MVLLDTNIFLEVFLNQEKAEECALLLHQVEEGKIDALVTDYTIHSIGTIIDAMGKGDLLPAIFASLSAFKSLTLIQANLEEQSEIATLIKDGLDFDDAYQVYFAKRYNVPIVSFDKHLDKFLIRKTPKDAIP
ncbi:MAG: PIN domain-containing protein [candidate division WOR-3 bacterium]